MEALGLDGVQVNLGQMAFLRALTGDLTGEVLEAIREAIDRIAASATGLRVNSAPC